MKVEDGAAWCQTLYTIGAKKKTDNRSISYYEHLWTDVIHFGGTSKVFQGCRLSPSPQSKCQREESHGQMAQVYEALGFSQMLDWPTAKVQTMEIHIYKLI